MFRGIAAARVWKCDAGSEMEGKEKEEEIEAAKRKRERRKENTRLKKITPRKALTNFLLPRGKRRRKEKIKKRKIKKANEDKVCRDKRFGEEKY